MAKYSRLVSFLYISLKSFFMPTIIQITLPTTRLKTLSKKSHASSQPVTSVDVPVLLSGTQVGRSASATPDTTIEIASSSESKTGIPASLKKEERRIYANLPIRADRFPLTIQESVYRERSIERSRRDWG